METPLLNQDIAFRSKEINNEGKKNISKLELIEEIIQTNLFLDNKLRYKVYIFLEKNQFQIKAFFDYNINEIYDKINQLNIKIEKKKYNY